MTLVERNRDARKLLAFFYRVYEEVGLRNFTISPQKPGTLAEVGLTEGAYHAARSRLVDKGILKPMTIGGGCSMTAVGVQASEDEAVLNRLLPVEAPESEERGRMPMSPDPKKVFIIHGRNVRARKAVEQFVRSLKLDPIDFDQISSDLGAVSLGEIVRAGLNQAQGIIALFTADEIASLRPEYHESHDAAEDKERWQARPNVLFEAGMAYGSAPERTILAVLGGQAKLFSDVRGLHVTYVGNSQEARSRLRQKLIGTKCAVDERSVAWLDPMLAGDFDSCVLPEVSTRDPFRD